MDRRKFLRILPISIAAVVIAPKLIIPKKGKSIWSKKVQIDLKNRISTLRNDYIIGMDPADPNGLSSAGIVHYSKSGREFTVFTGRQGKIDIQKACEELYLHYRDRNFLQMNNGNS
jgi:hypothetical protein